MSKQRTILTPLCACGETLTIDVRQSPAVALMLAKSAGWDIEGERAVCPKCQRADITDKVLIVRVAMIRPNADCIYAPSRLSQPFYTDRRNLEAIKDFSREILVSFAGDGVSDPQPTTAYGYAWHCWFIALESEPAKQGTVVIASPRRK